MTTNNVTQQLLSVIKRLLQMDMRGQELQCLMEHSDDGVDLLEDCNAAIAAAEQEQAEPVQAGRCAACNIETGTVRPCDICGGQTVAAQQQAEPVAAQCRFEGEKEWSPCTLAHHLLVQAHPKEWPHYETRALYAQPPAAAVPDGCVPVPQGFLQAFHALAHNYSLQAQAPDHYVGTERDAFSDAYARCGNELAKLRAMLAAAPKAATEGCGACGDGCQGQGCRLERESPSVVEQPVAHPCWSCGRLVTAERRAAADGDCPNCGAELDLEDWPAAAQKGGAA